MAALTALPAAAVALPAEGPVERRLGTPGTIAAALLAGAVAMALADRAPRRRRHDDAGAADALWLGAAQACALVPGVSRTAATLVAARLRGFDRPDAGRLSRHAALPVIAGAALLKGLGLYRRGLPARLVTGLTLARRNEQTAHHWVEVWVGDHWMPMCPFHGHCISSLKRA